MSGTTFGLELVNELRQQTQILAECVQLLATESYDNAITIRKELKKVDTILLNKIDQLEKVMKKEFLEIEEVSKTSKPLLIFRFFS